MLLGFYLTNNPLNKYEKDFLELSTIDINGKNKLLYGNWIWYDEDGVIKQEKTYDVNF